MNAPREIYVRQFHEELCDWSREGQLEILGRINEADDAFRIGTARDARGSVIRIGPIDGPAWLSQQDSNKAKGKPEPLHDWLQWWAKVAVRSGYRLPDVDPVAFDALMRLRADSSSRVEFILDTNALVSGVGHWLARFLGDRADLVRTVVSDLEIHDKSDNVKIGQTIRNIGHLSDRAVSLAASRFLERIPHPHPIWRRLDTGEETALFVAESSGGSKKGGRDTLLLRASRKTILDQVPGLQRFFVTDDRVVARAALHELPKGTVISTYVNPLSHAVSHISPYIWCPLGRNQGSVFPSDLAAFVWEALCVCAVVEIHRADRVIWRVRAYIPGANQFPSTWADPRVYLEEERPAQPKSAPAAKIPPVEISVEVASSSSLDPAMSSHSAPAERPAEALSSPGEPRADIEPKRPVLPSPRASTVEGKAVAKASFLPKTEAKKPSWPLKKQSAELLKPESYGLPDVPAGIILNAFAEIVAAIGEKRAPDLGRVAKARSLHHLCSFLQMGLFVDTEGRILSAGEQLPELFEANDLDGLSRLCTRVEPYRRLIETLSKRGAIPIVEVRALLRSADPLAKLARLLGQAVLDGDRLCDGGRWISSKKFEEWFFPAFEALAAASPLREAAVANLAQHALKELGLSPVRFGRALLAALRRPEFSAIEPAAGGADKPILVEHVASLARDGGLRIIEVNADGIHGMRSLKKRSS